MSETLCEKVSDSEHWLWREKFLLIFLFLLFHWGPLALVRVHWAVCTWLTNHNVTAPVPLSSSFHMSVRWTSPVQRLAENVWTMRNESVKMRRSQFGLRAKHILLFPSVVPTALMFPSPAYPETKHHGASNMKFQSYDNEDRASNVHKKQWGRLIFNSSMTAVKHSGLITCTQHGQH